MAFPITLIQKSGVTIARLRNVSFDVRSNSYVGEFIPQTMPDGLPELLSELEDLVGHMSIAHLDPVMGLIDKYELQAEFSDASKKDIVDLYVGRKGFSFRLKGQSIRPI